MAPSTKRKPSRSASQAKVWKAKKTKKNPEPNISPPSSPHATSSPPQVSEAADPDANPRDDAEEIADVEDETNFENLTLDNYLSQLNNWTVLQLRDALNQREKKAKTRASKEICHELQNIKTAYTKMKLMLALIGNVTETTVNHSL